jgi:hypothetical protein
LKEEGSLFSGRQEFIIHFAVNLFSSVVVWGMGFWMFLLQDVMILSSWRHPVTMKGRVKC